MGHKISPVALRIGYNIGWSSRWFFTRNYTVFLEADHIIRKTIMEMFPKIGIDDIVIERKSPEHATIVVKTSRPGILIGREGQNLKKIQKLINMKLDRLFAKHKIAKPATELRIEDIKKPFFSARVLAQMAATEIEKRQSVRRVMKKLMERVQQTKGLVGAKVKISGRLNGAEISRSEYLASGKLPLGTLKAKIDFANQQAKCTYGIVGIKVWLYKGESEDFTDQSE